KAAQVAGKLEAMRLSKAAALLREGVAETLSSMALPREHWTRLRTNNALERILREVRRRTRVVGNFPDGQSALLLVAARLRHLAGTKGGTRRYLDMGRLKEPEVGPVAEPTAAVWPRSAAGEPPPLLPGQKPTNPKCAHLDGRYLPRTWPP